MYHKITLFQGGAVGIKIIHFSDFFKSDTNYNCHFSGYLFLKESLREGLPACIKTLFRKKRSLPKEITGLQRCAAGRRTR